MSSLCLDYSIAYCMEMYQKLNCSFLNLETFLCFIVSLILTPPWKIRLLSLENPRNIPISRSREHVLGMSREPNPKIIHFTDLSAIPLAITTYTTHYKQHSKVHRQIFRAF
jgi:hypothetical protein